MTKAYLFVILTVVLSFFACRKQLLEEDNKQLTNHIAAQQANSGSAINPRLSYSDTIFYLKNQPDDYTISPVSQPVTSGYFKANPLGLALDSITGQINVTKSETGLRYKVYYISSTGARLDSVKLVVSGIDYADGIYELRSTPAAYDTAFPIYNAIPLLSPPCTPGDDNDDGDSDDDDLGCVFDETDLNNDGNDDIPGVIQDKLLIDTKKGTIDLEASFNAGVFGSAPGNGVTKDFTIYYRLTDASNRALNKITVRLYHFKKRSDIPQSLLNELNDKKNLAANVNSRASNNISAFNSRTRNSTESEESEASSESVESRPKRPPMIIIVSE